MGIMVCSPQICTVYGNFKIISEYKMLNPNSILNNDTERSSNRRNSSFFIM